MRVKCKRGDEVAFQERRYPTKSGLHQLGTRKNKLSFADLQEVKKGARKSGGREMVIAT